MKILYVIRQAPFPPTKGVEQRAYNIGKLLHKIGSVTLVMLVQQISPEAMRRAKEEFQDVHVFKLPEYEYSKAFDRWRARFKILRWTSLEDKVSPADELTFRELHSSHDLVWFHTLLAGDCFTNRKFPNAVMDIDDINHIKLALGAKLEGTIKRKLLAKWLAYKWRLHESRVLERFSIMTVCSQGDKSYFGDDERIHVVPNGFDRPDIEPTYQSPEAGRIGFIGAVTYGPNREGLAWFGSKVWPSIIGNIPTARLRIIGKLPEDRTFLNRQGFDTLGFVEDPTEEISTWSAMIVPLRIGGGTRIKILEAFSRKCPIVSTSIGAYGIDVTDSLNILLADEAESFASACMRLVREPDVAERLTAEGWQLFCNKYSWDRIGEHVGRAVNACMGYSERKEHAVWTSE